MKILNLTKNKTIFLRLHKYQNYGYSLSLTDMGIASLSFLISMISYHEPALFLDRNLDISKLDNYDNDEIPEDGMTLTLFTHDHLRQTI